MAELELVTRAHPTMTFRRRSCPKCGATFPIHVEFCGIDGEALLEGGLDPLIGRTIDRYQIVESIGDGGMARVYRARHSFLEQSFALKVLFGELALDTNLTRRFRREAHTAGKIRHPNVVSIIDFGKTDEGLQFLVMEYVEGHSLSQRIRGDEAHSVEWMARIVEQIAAGLDAAHALGFVHRDLKPGNVMVEAGTDHVRILDFGLVHLKHAEDESNKLTRTGQLLGTPTYMAPEQISAETVDGRTDLYALGVIMYEMISGRPPFNGEMVTVLTQHCAKPPAPLPACGGLERIALELLAKKPADRPANAQVVLRRIGQLRQAGFPLSTAEMPPVTLPDGGSAAPKPRASSTGWIVAIAGAILLAAAMIGWFGLPYDESADVATEELIAETPAETPDESATTTPDKNPRATSRKRRPRRRAKPAKAEVKTRDAPPEKTAVTPSAAVVIEKEPPAEPVPAKTEEPESIVTVIAPARAEPRKAVEAPPPTSLDRAVARHDKGTQQSAAEMRRLRGKLDKLRQPGATVSSDSSGAEQHKQAAIKAIAKKNMVQAELSLGLCLDANPKHAQCHKLLAVVHEMRGSKQVAAKHYQRYLDLTPNAADAASIRSIIERLRSS